MIKAIQAHNNIEPPYCTPLLKWPGGKRSLLRHILPLIPQNYGRYFEPFLGGGALFFALQPTRAYLSDNNPELINCYVQVRDRPNKVIAYLKRLKNTERFYYAVRSKKPKGEVARAGRLIYLTTLAFNGIHRLNTQGQFNVPYGHKGHLVPAEPDKILRTSAVLGNASLKSQDFELAVQYARWGDLVYLDPPYTVAHSNNGFLRYNAHIFSWEDQVRLARLARNLAARGCRVIVSNAFHESVLTLYRSFECIRFERSSIISANRAYRRRVVECVFHTGCDRNA